MKFNSCVLISGIFQKLVAQSNCDFCVYIVLGLLNAKSENFFHCFALQTLLNSLVMDMYPEAYSVSLLNTSEK